MSVLPAFGSFDKDSGGNGNRRMGKMRVVGFTGCCTIVCPCEDVPLNLPVCPGQYARVECPVCKTVHRVESISYYEPKLPERDEKGFIDPGKVKPPQVTIHFDSVPATIVPAPGLVV